MRDWMTTTDELLRLARETARTVPLPVAGKQVADSLVGRELNVLVPALIERLGDPTSNLLPADKRAAMHERFKSCIVDGKVRHGNAWQVMEHFLRLYLNRA